jgi:hypothetical protein
VGYSYGYVTTTIDWDTDRDLDFSDGEGRFRKHSVNLSLSRSFAERWTMQLGLGAVLGGDMRFQDRRFDLGAGWQAVLGVSVRVLDGDGWWPFVLVTGSFGVGHVLTEEQLPGGQSGLERLWALDGRGGLIVGEVFADVVTPYVAMRGFDLPVFWTLDGQAVLGADTNLYQAALGLMLSPVERADVIVEWAPLGERAFTLAGGWSF